MTLISDDGEFEQVKLAVATVVAVGRGLMVTLVTQAILLISDGRCAKAVR